MLVMLDAGRVLLGLRRTRIRLGHSHPLGAASLHLQPKMKGGWMGSQDRVLVLLSVRLFLLSESWSSVHPCVQPSW